MGLFSSKVRQLPKDTLHILNYCACMGNRFTVEEMVCVMETDSVALFEKLKPVLSLGLLLENKTDLQFVHDRVQEAVLNQTDEQVRASIHWRIGNRLLAAIPDDEGMETSDKLFAIATHLVRATSQAATAQNRLPAKQPTVFSEGPMKTCPRMLGMWPTK